MRDIEAIAADAVEKRAFSNHTEFEIWEERWCDRCKVDGPYRRDEAVDGCPLLALSVVGMTPAEWKPAVDRVEAQGRYECTEFVPDDEDGDGETVPEPEPDPVAELDGQIDMFEVFAEQITETASECQSVSA